MYKGIKVTKSSIQVNKSTEGETIERKIRRIVNNNEPISDGAPLIYTERKDGVQPDYDIRTDRWEHAVEGMGKVSKMKFAEREKRHNPEKPGEETKGAGGDKPAEGGA